MGENVPETWVTKLGRKCLPSSALFLRNNRLVPRLEADAAMLRTRARSLRAALFLAVLCLAQARALEVAELYRAEVIVTGTEEPERTRGLRAALTDVLIKLTGDARLANSPVLAPLLERAPELVDQFEYEDRMKGIPIHDEQGTRERPHYLRAAFRPAALDAAIGDLGLKKWTADRPLTAVWLGMQTAVRSYVVPQRGDEGYGPRAVIEETARRRGLPVMIAPQADAFAISPSDLAAFDVDKIRKASLGSDALLIGMLRSTPSGYWDAEWRLGWKERAETWSAHGVTYDTAIKQALERSALLFSGNASRH